MRKRRENALGGVPVPEVLESAGFRTGSEFEPGDGDAPTRPNRKRDLSDLAGRLRLRDDFDHKTLRIFRHGAD